MNDSWNRNRNELPWDDVHMRRILPTPNTVNEICRAGRWRNPFENPGQELLDRGELQCMNGFEQHADYPSALDPESLPAHLIDWRGTKGLRRRMQISPDVDPRSDVSSR